MRTRDARPNQPRMPWRTVALLCLGLLLLVNVTTAEAQGSRNGSSGPFEYIKADRNTVRIQVTLGIQYHQQALDILMTAASREDFAQASALLGQSYVMLRYAVHGLDLIAGQSKWVTDPLIDMAKDRLWKARWIIIDTRPSIDAAATWEQRNAEALARAVEQLYLSSSLIQQAADLI